MIEFSSSRRTHTQGDVSSLADYESCSQARGDQRDYRPFSTMLAAEKGKADAAVVRPSLHLQAKNSPMSLELHHKRSVHQPSKSVQKPKKGILKQSSSYLDSGKKQPGVQFKPSLKLANGMPPSHSPYTAFAKGKAKGTAAQQAAQLTAKQRVGS